jgi:CRP/FNR family transcriptional regulator, cyclic AMP receptor protein
MSKQRLELSRKRKLLAAAALAQKIGYLNTQDFTPSFFDDLPKQVVNAHRILRPKDELFVVEKGVVEIWHARHDMLVTELGARALFGDMSLLGQSMFGCQAIAGSGGARLGVLNLELITEWVSTSPLKILEEIGPRLVLIETEHYRTAFQAIPSRVAALLLELAGTTSTVEGYIQEELAERLGAYRETIANSVKAMKERGLIEVGRKKITILNKEALRELSEL